MKKLITLAISNPVTILMMVLAIGLLGKISYDKLSVDLFPDLNNPKLFVESLQVNGHLKKWRSNSSNAWNRWLSEEKMSWRSPV